MKKSYLCLLPIYVESTYEPSWFLQMAIKIGWYVYFVDETHESLMTEIDVLKTSA